MYIYICIYIYIWYSIETSDSEEILDYGDSIEPLDSLVFLVAMDAVERIPSDVYVYLYIYIYMYIYLHARVDRHQKGWKKQGNV